MNIVNINGYENLEVIGEGGGGCVYKARETATGRTVAIKILLPGLRQKEVALARFKTEARTLAALSDPRLVVLYAVIETTDGPALVLEFVENSLAQRINGQPLPEAEAASIACEVASVLDKAHKKGIFHRDVKPSNILLSGDGTPKLTDFGLAKQVGQPSRGATVTGQILGTPSYMPPEQARGDVNALDARADVYTLGATLYEMLTGEPPFTGPTPLAVLSKVLAIDPVSPRVLRPELNRDLETICLKCLRKEPAKRYASAEALAEDLRRFLAGEAIWARPTPAWERGWKWAKRRPLVAALILAGPLAGLVFAVMTAVIYVVWRSEQEQRRQAELRLAVNDLDQGLGLCEQGEVCRGLLWQARALQQAPEDDTDLRRVIRLNLVAWGCKAVQRRAVAKHDGGLHAVYVSHNGRTTLTCDTAGVACLWDADTGEQRPFEPLRRTKQLWQGAFSPDDRCVAVCGEDETACLWDPSNGHLLHTLRHGGTVWSVAFSPDGRTLATGSADKTACLWDVKSGEKLIELSGHGGDVAVVAFSPDGKRVLTASFDGTARLWDAATGRQWGAVFQHRKEVFAAQFSPDGTRVVTGSYDGTARIWNAETGKPIGTPMRHDDRIHAGAAVFSPDGQTVVTGSFDRTARVWDAATGLPRVQDPNTDQPAQPVLYHQCEVHRIDFSRDGRTLLTCGSDGSVHLWDAATGQPLLREPLRLDGGIEMAVFGGDGRTVWVADTGPHHTASLFALPPAPRPPTLELRDAGVKRLALSLDGGTVLTNDRDGAAVLWDAATGKRRTALASAPRDVFAAAFSADGKVLVTGGKIPHLWNAATGELLLRLQAHPDDVHGFALAFSGDGRTLCTGDHNSVVRLWGAGSGDCHQKFSTGQHGGVAQVVFSSDDRRLAVGGYDGTVYLWDPATREKIGNPMRHERPVEAVAFSPDGRTVLTASADKTARLWDAPDGRLIRTLVHDGPVHAAVFSPDGAVILTGAADGSGGSACLWDGVTGRRLGPPIRHPDPVFAVAFRPGGREVITASLGSDGRVQVLKEDVDWIGRAWRKERTAAAEAKRAVLWIEVVTGMALGEDNVIRVLNADDWQDRRQRLDGMGGPPVAELPVTNPDAIKAPSPSPAGGPMTAQSLGTGILLVAAMLLGLSGYQFHRHRRSSRQMA